MSDDLISRISEINRNHLLIRYDRRAWWCQCGDDCLSVEGSHSQHVADAVIRSINERYVIVDPLIRTEGGDVTWVAPGAIAKMLGEADDE